MTQTDPNGNSITYGTSAISTQAADGTAGPSITFTRDGQGRITAVTGPSGQSLTYTYSGTGDLASVTDPVGNLTTFTYDTNHDLLKVSGTGGSAANRNLRRVRPAGLDHRRVG